MPKTRHHEPTEAIPVSCLSAPPEPMDSMRQRMRFIYALAFSKGFFSIKGSSTILYTAK